MGGDDLDRLTDADSITSRDRQVTPSFTALQGQYLAFIHAYTVLHRRPPAERDFQHFFRVTPPTVHRMIVALHDRGLIDRVPGRQRSSVLRVPPDRLPPLAAPG